MNKEQKIISIMHGFIGDIFGNGSVKHKIIEKISEEETQLKWVGGCFGCYLQGEKIDAYTIIKNDNFIVKIF